MKRILAAAALAGACALAGWYPEMACQQRDLPSGKCTDAKYSCVRLGTKLAYYRVGPRCVGDNEW